MHLFDIAEFGTRFGIDTTVSDFREAVVEASKGATADLAARLRYRDFSAYSNRRDFFVVDRMFGVANTLQRQFLLSRGFVENATVSAVYATTPLSLRNGNTTDLKDLADLNEDGESNMLMIDGPRGILTAYGVDLTERWVMVTYSGGLDVATDNEYQTVPDWLREVAMARAALILTRNRAFRTEGEDDTAELRETVRAAVTAHMRYAPGAAQAVATEPTH